MIKKLVATALFGSFVLCSTLSAQLPLIIPGPCPPLQDDGLAAAGCCNPAAPQLPTIPAMSFQGTYYLDSSCAVPPPSTVNIQLGSPFAVTCGNWAIPINISRLTGTGPTNPVGNTLVATYSRTWATYNSFSQQTGQVFRFTVSTDVNWIGPTPANPQTDPPCTAAFGNVVHLIGSVDFHFEPAFLDPKTGEEVHWEWVGPDGEPPLEACKWNARIDLHHPCDLLEHDAGFAARPGVFHPNTGYHFVGPNPVVLAPAGGLPQTPVSIGTFVQEAFRESIMPPTLVETCLGEMAPVTQSVFANQSAYYCMCNPTQAGRTQDQILNSGYQCFPNFTTFNNFALAPPHSASGFLSWYAARHPITGSGNYPEGQDVWYHWGVLSFNAQNPPPVCAGATVAPVIPFEFTTGVVTNYLPFSPFSGKVNFSPGVPQPPLSQYRDLRNHLWLNSTATALTQTYGRLTAGTWIANYAQ